MVGKSNDKYPADMCIYIPPCSLSLDIIIADRHITFHAWQDSRTLSLIGYIYIIIYKLTHSERVFFESVGFLLVIIIKLCKMPSSKLV